MKHNKILFIVLGFALFAASAFVLFEPSTDPTGFFTYTPGIAVINPENTAQLNTNLEIEFMTSGTKDLTITATNGNIQFIGLKCGETAVSPSATSENIEYQNYFCKETSKLVVKVLSQELDLELKFGSDVQQVSNIAPPVPAVATQQTVPPARTSSCGCGAK